ncbi:MAG: hypothetical protein WKF89_12585 [Chitinophagaceae bacterium]
MKVRFVVEKGKKGPDNVEVLLHGIKNLPKNILITAEDYTTPIGTGKAFLIDDQLVVEADLREQEFDLYPTIAFESIREDNTHETIIIKESELHTVSLQPFPNTDPDIKTINEQIAEGNAEVI